MKRFALKRITALALALVMTLSLLPMNVWAEELQENTDEQVVVAAEETEEPSAEVVEEPAEEPVVEEEVKSSETEHVSESAVVSAPLANSAASAYEARWGLATGEKADQAPTKWTNGTLAEAMTYANGLALRTAYIQLLSDVNTNAIGALEFVEDTTTILDLNGKTIDRGLTAATENGYVIKVYGNLTLCDTSTTATTAPGKIFGDNASVGVCGVYVAGTAQKEASFIMNSGSISGNTQGGVSVGSNGVFVMNGGTISGNGGCGVSIRGGTFTMNDGFISENTAAYSGGGIYIDSGIFTMNGGTISGNTAFTNGGGVYLNGGTFTMNGGSISENTASYGGGVYGPIIMNGGSITGNAASSGGGLFLAHGNTTVESSVGTAAISGNTASSGGGVYIQNASTSFRMRSGSISGNTATNRGGGMYIVDGSVFLSNIPTINGNKEESGASAKDNNIYLISGKTITVGTLNSGANIGITLADGSGTFTSGGYSYAKSGYFTSDNTGYTVLEDGENLKLAVPPTSQVRWGKVAGTNNDEMPTNWFYGTLDEAETYANALLSGKTYIQLLESVTSSLWLSSGQKAILDLNGKTLDGGYSETTKEGSVITVFGELLLCDTSSTIVEEQGKVTGAYNPCNYGGGVSVKKGGIFIMNGGNITGNRARFGAGVDAGSGTFVMNGGSIFGNAASNEGGGVHVSYWKGTCTMNGGSISENTAPSGGGVFVYGGTFNMTGGSISENTASYGGGVYMGYRGTDSTFTMSGGTIIGNTATKHGGGVGSYYNEDNYFKMSGGSILGNSAEEGGGVQLGYGFFFMNGGKISGNTAIDIGGGVYCYDEMHVSGTAIISGNMRNGTLNETTGLYEMGGNGSENNLCCYNGGVFFVGALQETASIGVTTETIPTTTEPVAFAQGSAYTLTERDAAKFTSDDGYLIELDSMNNALQLVKPVPPVVGLNTTSGSLNLFQETALTIPVECNYEFLGVRFKNSAVSAVFDISVVENGIIQITPKDKPEDMTWAEWGKEVAGSYKSAIEVEYIRGQYVTTPETLTINLTATTPKVTATAVKFNSFRAGDTQPLVLTTTNGVVTNVTIDESKENPAWVVLNEDQTVTLINENLGSNTGSGKLNLEVWLEGWRVPAEAVVSVSAAYSAPKLKLSASSVNLVSNSLYQEPIAMQLLSGDTTAFDALGVTNLRVADVAEMSDKDKKTYAASAYVKVVEDSYQANGEFMLMTEGMPINGKVLLLATIEGAATEIAIPLTVNVVMPALKANPAKVTLNTAKGYDEGARDEMTVTFSGDVPEFWYSDVSYEITPPKNASADMLTVENNGDGTVTFYANEGIVDGSYKVNVTVGAAKPVAITVTAKATLPKLKLNKSSITLNTAMGDNADVQTVTVADSDVNYDFVLLQEEITAPASISAVVSENNTIAVSALTETANGSYKVEIDHKMPGGQSVKSTLTVKVVEKLPTLKADNTTLSLDTTHGIATVNVDGLAGFGVGELVAEPTVEGITVEMIDRDSFTVKIDETLDKKGGRSMCPSS